MTQPSYRSHFGNLAALAHQGGVGFYADWIVVQMSDWRYRWFDAIHHSPPIMEKTDPGRLDSKTLDL